MIKSFQWSINEGFEYYPSHKELIRSYIDELNGLENQARTQGFSKSFKDKTDFIFENTKE